MIFNELIDSYTKFLISQCKIMCYFLLKKLLFNPSRSVAEMIRKIKLTLAFISQLSENISALLSVLEENQSRWFGKFKPTTANLFEEIFKIKDINELMKQRVVEIERNDNLKSMVLHYDNGVRWSDRFTD